MKTHLKLLVIRTRPSRALHSCFYGLAKFGHEVERQRLTDDDHGILSNFSGILNADKLDRQSPQKAYIFPLYNKLSNMASNLSNRYTFNPLKS